MDMRVGKAKGRKENVSIADVPSNIDKARGLGYVNLRLVIAKGYSTCSPSGPMRPTPSSPPEMGPKKSKSSKMAKVIKAMKRKAVVEGSRKECRFQTLHANNMNFTRITKLKGGYIEMEVKKNEMEVALKSAEVAMREQEAWHKADINAHDAYLEKLKKENWDLLAKNKDLESKVKAMEEELKGLQDQEVTIVEDLVKTCLRVNILSELKTQNPEADWSWVNKIYPDEVEEDEEDRGAEETRGDALPQGLSVEDLPS
ncbi:hypothetical protein JCGZ_27154 [Jatropha curcas]|uniref:Uncharacterized protein n=1 Tax=Jatropha curcas TaxID=180498 RepID=A0A067JV28_JATCU|nr:hypothetical protein JCGZ_27154 [Jatropha curcas]